MLMILHIVRYILFRFQDSLIDMCSEIGTFMSGKRCSVRNKVLNSQICIRTSWPFRNRGSHEQHMSVV